MAWKHCFLSAWVCNTCINLAVVHMQAMGRREGNEPRHPNFRVDKTTWQLGNPTYVRDEVGLMVFNFRHKIPKMSNPFIFPSQATQVFWSKEVARLGWRVVLAKEAWEKRHKQCTTDVFITRGTQVDGMDNADRLHPSPTIVSLMGAIELSNFENLLALARF